MLVFGDMVYYWLNI